jgi:arsenite methyltransferase
LEEAATMQQPIPTELQAPDIELDALRRAIQLEYAEVAEHPEEGFHFHTGRKLAAMLGYADEWFDGVPEGSIESFAGTGNPFSLGVLQPGERVVDVGSDAGLDTRVAARMVGATGHVIGVDMTPAMLQKARGAASSAGLESVEFREGFAEAFDALQAFHTRDLACFGSDVLQHQHAEHHAERLIAKTDE